MSRGRNQELVQNFEKYILTNLLFLLAFQNWGMVRLEKDLNHPRNKENKWQFWLVTPLTPLLGTQKKKRRLVLKQRARRERERKSRMRR